MCILTCLVKSEDVLNDFSHTVHFKGFSPVCTLIFLNNKLEDLLNVYDLSHKLLSIVFFPECTLIGRAEILNLHLESSFVDE